MANRSVSITKVPQDLKMVAEAALVVGTAYIVQNAGVDNIHFAEIAAAPIPTTEEISFFLSPGDFGSITPSADPFWFWSVHGDAVSLRINEAPS